MMPHPALSNVEKRRYAHRDAGIQRHGWSLQAIHAGITASSTERDKVYKSTVLSFQYVLGY